MRVEGSGVLDQVGLGRGDAGVPHAFLPQLYLEACGVGSLVIALHVLCYADEFLSEGTSVEWPRHLPVTCGLPGSWHGDKHKKSLSWAGEMA